MNKVKILKIILIFFIVLCLGLGGFGYYSSTTKFNNKDSQEENKYNVSMIYYLNGTQKLTEMPINSDEELYEFEKYVCSNKVKGTWDEKKWEFNVERTADATCKLYFVSAVYDVTMNVINGALDPNAITKVDSNSDGVFKINSNEGYTYDKTTCANNEEIFWDEVKSELTVKTIKSNTVCDVSFKLKEYNTEISVTNGGGSTTKVVAHGQNLTSAVTATSGYGNPTITCNNTDLGQSVTAGTWANGVYTMNSITSNIKCVIEFKLVDIVPVTYRVDIEIVPSGTATATTPLTVKSGESVTFAIDVTAGYKIGDLTECRGAVNNENGTITISNVQKNTTCRIIIVENQ